MANPVSPRKARQAVEASQLDTGSMCPSVKKLAEDGRLDHVYSIPLVELNCQFGIVRNRTEEAVPLQKVVKRERSRQQSKVTMVFAHGRQLSELVAQEPSAALLATVKETGVDDKALLDFYETYFARHVIYKDEKWKLYHAMGGRKIGVGKLMSGLLKSFRRHRANKIEASPNVTAGDGWMQGGVLIFDRRGHLKHVIEEDYGEPLDVEAIKKVIEEIKKKQSAKDTDDSGSQFAEDSSDSIHEITEEA